MKENAQELSINLTELSGQNCLSCVVLQCSKIKREHLFLLENKQLAIYLNDRCISTERCSEKYHLVDLIMEFAERHGIKSGDDLENECMHRGHVEELKRKAELLRIQEQRRVEENSNEQESELEPETEPEPDPDPESELEDELEPEILVNPDISDDTEQAHFSGDGVSNAPSSNNNLSSNTEPSDGDNDETIQTNNEGNEGMTNLENNGDDSEENHVDQVTNLLVVYIRF